jgi:transcriptional regulator with XRE-family HTH domain
MPRKRTAAEHLRIDLRTARIARKLSQLKLSMLSGIDQGRISKIENGEIKDPAFSTVRHLARALNMDPRDLRFARDDAA